MSSGKNGNPKTESNNMYELCVKHVEEDRNQSKEAIDIISDYFSRNAAIDPESFSKIMMSYSKLIENLQKSNEQMVNIFLAKTKEKPAKESLALSEEEKKLLMEK